MFSNGWGETLMASHKISKISSDLNRAISEILFDSARDELLKTITITGSKVSKDLSYAKVYFTSLSDLSKEQLEKEMKEAAPFIRSEVAERLDMRHTPILDFVYDESIEYANKIETIIKEIHENE